MTRKITSHKGGRTVRRPAVMTPETADGLNAILARQGISFGDWIEANVKLDKERQDGIESFLYTATEQIEIGQIVVIDGAFIRLLDPKKPKGIAAGVALHDISKGDVVEYSPLKNTRDIAIFLA